MNNSRRKDNIFGISIITVTFIAGFTFNSFTRDFLTDNTQKFSNAKECYIGHICFTLHNGEQFVIDQNDYVRLIDNEIQGIERNNIMLRRRLGLIPLQEEVTNTNNNACQVTNAPQYQLFFDFYDDKRLIQTLSPQVRRNF